MVKVKENAYYLTDGSIDVDEWLHYISQHYSQEKDIRLIRHACSLSQLAGHGVATESGESCLQQGLAMAEILIDLGVDPQTIAAALIYESVHYAELTIDDIEEHLGSNVAKLVSSVARMSEMNAMMNLSNRSKRSQIDNVRKMLLSMVDDVRGVLIKLAERLRVLRTVAGLSNVIKLPIAKEVMEIYAPLANRLGVGAIKWEMEDLAFRCLSPEKYKEIAKGLKARRLDRDRYVTERVSELNDTIEHKGIQHYQVYGRSKHIHSIYKKMLRKKAPLEEIYDITALRVLVEKLDDCYEVLSIAHGLWQSIPEEFDDYISNPKPNGYRSLHTAVIGPEGKNFEVQIRTKQMHDEAELGVAAHWKYKEGASGHRESHERKIEWLRDLLAWQQELAQAGGVPEDIKQDFFEDRVYVFTPEGEVVDLPHGSTPLDFAYYIHSQVGHRCRGAKINERIVPLNHILQTGDRVEILTGKEVKPSLDWINPNLNYVKSSRAKAKIHHWFKQQDFEKNREEGEELFNKELARLQLKAENLDEIAQGFNFKKKDDLMAALGRSDVRLSHIISKLTPSELQPSTPKIKKAAEHHDRGASDDIQIQNVGNLLTHIAKCCHPVPGDEIIGYITIGRGVSIHRKDCANIFHTLESNEAASRLIEVSWGENVSHSYQVNVQVEAHNHPNLLREITQILSLEKVNVFALSTEVDHEEQLMKVSLTVEVDGVEGLSRLLAKFRQSNLVIEAKRV